MKRIIKISYLFFVVLISTGMACSSQELADTTTVNVTIPDEASLIDPMIYGQMLEHVNDRMIYDGIINEDGSERNHVTDLIKPLKFPVVRWPGGTVVREYNWENGIGPVSERPTLENHAWGGKESNYFGTDEFLQWCKEIGTEPYINFNMNSNQEFGGTLENALNWIEYVNGSKTTEYGRKRANNGHEAPYDVKFWGIGNENWGSFGVDTKESDSVYAERLYTWAKEIRSQYPDLKLLSVGHKIEWDRTVLKKAGSLIDYLTQHYYITSQIKDNQVINPENSVFAPVLVEAHLQKVGQLVQNVNSDLGRLDNPIRLSIDEWNNRHFVHDGDDSKFTRQDPRRQLDVAVVAGMLNIFIRQSPTVGMANYIFPVNAHGLIRTIGDDEAFKTTIYYVFEKYRNWMTGSKLSAVVNGPGIPSSDLDFSIAGDAAREEIKMNNQHLNFIDVAAVQKEDKTINVALVNRSSELTQSVELNLPDRFTPSSIWKLTAPDISSANTANNQNTIKPFTEEVNRGSSVSLNIPPAGLYIIQYNDSL